MIRIVIYSRQESERQKLRSLLNKETDFKVIAEASDGPEMIDLIDVRSVDILLFSLFDIYDLEILRSENQKRLNIKIIVIYYNEKANYINEMLRLRAQGYIYNETMPDELAHAIREVMAGKIFLSRPLYEKAVQNYINREQSAINSPFDLLTKRELEIFNMVVKGFTSAQIGKVLSISRRTVEIHRANMLRKLNLASQYKQIKNYAMELGITPDKEARDLM